MRAPVGLYVHLPFCASKCAYCDFPSFAGQLHLRAAYTQAVVAEIARRGAVTGMLAADSLFLGGGTPSLMAAGQLAQIFRQLRASYRILPDAEITCEANPGTLSAQWLEDMVALGVNRLSLGAQSAHEGELRELGRPHSWAQVEAAVRLARAQGLSNLNLDLMSALPGQTWDRLRYSLDSALALRPTHLSVYSLIIEPGTPFFERHQAGQLNLPDEEEERQLYWNTVAHLERAGYRQYEISNFCLPGFECRHNLNCWRYHELLGFGSSAGGMWGHERRKNPDSLQDYLAGQPPQLEQLSPRDRRFEQVMLALRLKEGLSLRAFEQAQGLPLEKAFPGALARQLAGGLVELKDHHLRLTRAGFDLMDRVLLDFLPDEGLPA